MIKVISFDIGGTLIKGVNNKYTITEFSKLINQKNDEIKLVYRDVFQKQEGTFDELVEEFCDRLHVKVTDGIKKFLYDNFNQECYFDKTSLPVIRKLKELGYKVILFSNNSPLYPDNLDKEIYKLVDNIFYSYQILHTKDEEESYRYIENKLGVKPNEILHIGDSYDNDYVYPKKYGWNTILLGHKDGIKCINNLNDIFNCLN